MTSNTHRTKEGWLVMDGDINRTRDVEATGRLDWDRDLLDFITHYIHPGDVVVDAGASIGDCTIAFQESVGDDGFVLAYEPLKLAYECLVQNCRGPNIHCYQLGLGDKFRHLGMAASEHADFGTHYMTEAGIGDVGIVTLDRHHLFWPKKMPQARLDFIKLDVEGMEYQALRGAKELISVFHPVLFVECYKQALARFHATVHGIKALLESFGYSDFRIYEPYKDWHWDYFNVLAMV